MLSEAKLNNIFPVVQFLRGGYSPPFRLDLDNTRGGIILFARVNIPSNILPVENHPI